MVSVPNCPGPFSCCDFLICNPNPVRNSRKPCVCFNPPQSLPPPPPPAEGGSSVAFTTGVIAIICTLGAAFVLVIFYTIVAKYCRSREIFRRRSHRHEREVADQSDLVWSVVTRGIDESLIKMIPVCKFSKGEGLVEGTECAVCLSEFEENEALRLLPKCSHAFHLPCIDKWLQTHTNCPLCRANISIPAPRPPLIAVDEGTSGHSSQPPLVNEALEEECGPSGQIEEGNYAEMPEQTAKDGDSDQTAGRGQVPVDHGAAERGAGNELEHQLMEPQTVIGQGAPSARYSDEVQAAYSKIAAPIRSFSAGLVVNEGEEGRRRYGDSNLRGVWNPKTDHSNNSSSSMSHLRRAYSTGGSFAKSAEVEIASSNEREQRTTRTSCRRGRATRSSSESARDEAAGDDTTTSATRRSLKGVVDVEAGLTESRRRRRSREEMMMMGDEEEANLKVGKLLQSLKGSFGLTRSWSCGGGGGRLIFGCMNGDSRNTAPVQSRDTHEFLP